MPLSTFTHCTPNTLRSLVVIEDTQISQMSSFQFPSLRFSAPWRNRGILHLAALWPCVNFTFHARVSNSAAGHGLSWSRRLVGRRPVWRMSKLALQLALSSMSSRRTSWWGTSGWLPMHRFGVDDGSSTGSSADLRSSRVEMLSVPSVDDTFSVLRCSSFGRSSQPIGGVGHRRERSVSSSACSPAS